MFMKPVRAHVENGRIVVDEATNLPEGTLLSLVAIPGDDLDDGERAELHAAISESLEEVKAGKSVDAADVIAELRARA